MAEILTIIVTWNSARVIRACLESLGGEPTEILVVDNASSDNTVALVRSALPEAILLAQEKNLGFAAAVNAAVRATRQPFLLLLNPDAILQPGAIASLGATLKEHLRAAAVGGLLVDPQGRPQQGFYARRFPTLTAMIFEALLLNRLWPANPVNRSYRCFDLDPTTAAEVDQPAGAFLLLRRSALEQVGLLDEQFHPLWFEDVDLCRRLRRAGFEIRYCPQSRAIHTGAHSLELMPEAQVQQYWYRNLLRYFAKHHGMVETALLRLAVASGMLIRLVAVAVARPPRGTARGEAARAYWTVFKNCWTSA